MEKIRFENITKTFGSTVANNDISFSIEAGEVFCILGENGSGKTTLLNVLAGIYKQDAGRVFIDGKEVNIESPKDAYKYKIGMVHQHFKLVEVFTALENILLGLKQKLTEKDVIEICDKYGFKLDPKKYVYDMSISEKQTLEIVKTLFRGVDTLILDEPTAVLTPQEITHLFEIIRNMKKDGKTIIIITHKLNEVMEISDRIAILRKGEYIVTVDTALTNERRLADLMVGHKTDLNIKRSEIPNTGVRLSIKNLSALDIDGNKALEDISFDVYGSEILGVAGISGSGQRELLETIAGLNKETKGSIIFTNPKKDKPVTFYHKNVNQIKELSKEGKFYYADTKEKCDLTNKTNKEITDLVNAEKILFYEDEIIDLKDKKPLEIRDLGIKLSFVPEDRLGMGLVGNMDLTDNMMLRSYRKGKQGFVDREKPHELAEKIVQELDVKTPSLNTEVRKLSGGNIQKILVGRELSSRPKILMTAYPVRGLDINSSYLIYKLLDEQKVKGTAIIFVGEDLDVLMDLCDRLLILSNGHITGIVDPRKITKDEIGLLMTQG
ncbi:MAG: ABC transporter ATP-binding protein [Bacilli bacterium]|nr:ABC transporter ATP-binding protein [Bacilli bacterium]